MNYRISFLGKFPKQVAVAVSGGPDSMAILDFLIKGKREILALHFNHGTKHGEVAEKFVTNYCNENGIDWEVRRISREKLPSESPEEYWRNERYLFLDHHAKYLPVITCHHLNDQVENWILTSILDGKPRLIPYRRGNVIRPFLTTRKASLESWCDRKGIPYLIDMSNFDPKYARSRVRNKIVPEALAINPGLYKVIRKKVKKEFDLSNNLR
jgi:tRNA(Ile)-lysidine synthase